MKRPAAVSMGEETVSFPRPYCFALFGFVVVPVRGRPRDYRASFCHVLIKKMCTLESSKGRRRRPSRKKPVATRVVVSTHASEQVVGARLFAEKEKQSKLCSNVVGVSLKDL